MPTRRSIAARLPHRGGGVEVAIVDRLEVGAGDCGRPLGAFSWTCLPASWLLPSAQRSAPAAARVSVAPDSPGVRIRREPARCSRASAGPIEYSVAVPVYRGRFGPRQAERLLWRAGFGPRPGEARKLARKGLKRRRPLADPAKPTKARAASGPKPHDERRPAARAGRRLGPRPALVARPDGAQQPAAGRADDADLARLVRDRRRRLKSCSNLTQNELFRRKALGSFRRPAARASPRTRRCWSGSRASRTPSGRRTRTTRRELMELFTLGAECRLHARPTSASRRGR